MKNILAWLDNLAAINSENFFARALDRIAFVFLFIMVVSAPHSIAATQIAWLTGMLAWLIRFAFKPRPRFGRTALHLALLAFFGLTVVSSVFSYEPAISLDKLRGAGLFMIFFFAASNVRSNRAAVFLASALILSAMVNVIWTPLERLIGRGMEIHGLSPNSPLARAGLADGDTIFRVNGRRLTSPDELASALEQRETADVRFHRPDIERTAILRRSDLLAGQTAAEKLGFQTWHKNRKWRATGFYGHFTTYSEVLQLIGSLAFGLILAGIYSMVRSRGGDGTGRITIYAATVKLLSEKRLMLLAASFGLIMLALLLSGTRASQIGMMGSAFAMVAALGSRKLLAAMILAALPVGLLGYYALLQTRQQDETNEYRMTMWRDGVRLAAENPRHLAVGVGMDSIKKHWTEWGLFDGGRLPMGHFHSTPIQLAVERGLPALLVWLIILWIYALTMWRFIAQKLDYSDWPLTGIAIGCLGGLVGFSTAGIVHYNLGDGEVVMVFYLLMAIGIKIVGLAGEKHSEIPA